MSEQMGGERIAVPLGRPLEVRVAMIINGGAATVFFAVALIRQLVEGGGGLLAVPIYLVILAAGTIVLLVTRPRNTRLLAGITALLPVLLHLLVVLGGQAWWVRVLSGVLAATYVYSVVLINTKPARIHLDGLA
jgi:hypothetical protein